MRKWVDLEVERRSGDRYADEADLPEAAVRRAGRALARATSVYAGRRRRNRLPGQHLQADIDAAVAMYPAAEWMQRSGPYCRRHRRPLWRIGGTPPSRCFGCLEEAAAR